MKIIRYAAVAALAIGLCTMQCRALTADEWMDQHVSKITDNSQKTILASWLYWKIKEFDAETAARDAEGAAARAAARAARDAEGAAARAARDAEGAAWAAAARAADAAAAAVWAAARAARDARAAARAARAAARDAARDAMESFYIALWNKNNFGENVLANTEVFGGAEGIKFPAPQCDKSGSCRI